MDSEKYDMMKLKETIKRVVKVVEVKIKSTMRSKSKDRKITRDYYFSNYANEFPVSRNTYYKYKQFANDKAKLEELGYIGIASFYDICKYAGVSADYLLGFIESERKEESANMVKKEFGLSDEAMARLVTIKHMDAKYMGSLSSDMISFILSNSEFWDKFNEFLPMYIKYKSEFDESNISALKLDMIKYSLFNMFEELINELCDFSHETSPQKPSPAIDIKFLERTGMKITKEEGN